MGIISAHFFLHFLLLLLAEMRELKKMNRNLGLRLNSIVFILCLDNTNRNKIQAKNVFVLLSNLRLEKNGIREIQQYQ